MFTRRGSTGGSPAAVRVFMSECTEYKHDRWDGHDEQQKQIKKQTGARKREQNEYKLKQIPPPNKSNDNKCIL